MSCSVHYLILSVTFMYCFNFCLQVEECVLSVCWLSPSEDPDKYSLRWCGSVSEAPVSEDVRGDNWTGPDRSFLDAV